MNTAEILDRLDEKADEGLARMVYTGRALSKSDRHLHMCVSSGVVLIPLDDIDAMDHVYKDIDPALLFVTVRNADRVRHALRIDQLRDTGAAAPAPAERPMDLTHWDHGTRTDMMILDACDATDVFVPPTSFTSG